MGHKATDKQGCKEQNRQNSKGKHETNNKNDPQMKRCLQVRNPFNFVSTQYFENESMEFDNFLHWYLYT